MRLQPPRTRKKQFKGDEIEEYFLAHVVVGREQPVKVLDFLKEVVDEFKDPMIALDKFLDLWPPQYHYRASEVFGPYAEKYADEY